MKVINILEPLVNNANKWILKQDETYRENVDTPEKILDLLSNFKQIKSNNVISIANEESFLPIESVKKILRIQRNPMNSQKSYEFTEILGIHRNPTNSQKSYEFTNIL